MSTDALITAIGIAITASIAFAAYLAAQRANVATANASKVAVDAGAYTRARELYEGVISQLRVQSRDLEASVTELREEVSRLRAQSADLSAEVSRMRGVNDELRGVNTGLRDQLAALQAQLARLSP